MGDSSQATAVAGAIHFVLDEDHGSVQDIVAGGRRVVDGTRRGIDLWGGTRKERGWWEGDFEY